MKLEVIVIILLCSIVLRKLLIVSGQNWMRTQSALLSMALLPIITYVITSVISGNIALSLGMVGALSIIRFRNPVKSPLELVSYFLMITVGISASVDVKWAVYLVIASAVVILSVHYASKIFSSRGVQLFPNSFAEANSLHTIEIISNRFHPLWAEHDLLVNLSSNDGSYMYRLASSDKNRVVELINEAENNNMEYLYQTA